MKCLFGRYFRTLVVTETPFLFFKMKEYAFGRPAEKKLQTDRILLNQTGDVLTLHSHEFHRNGFSALKKQIRQLLVLKVISALIWNSLKYLLIESLLSAYICTFLKRISYLETDKTAKVLHSTQPVYFSFSYSQDVCRMACRHCNVSFYDLKLRYFLLFKASIHSNWRWST